MTMPSPIPPAHWPTEIRLLASRRSLHLTFHGDARVYQVSAEALRVDSPSAEVQGHGPGQKIMVTGKADVKITDIIPVGHYAVRLVFDDGHDSGLYTWQALYDFAQRSQIGEA